jgi:hypothetical protein
MKKAMRWGESPDSVTVCEIPRLAGNDDDPDSDIHQCMHELHPKVTSEGYCYIDPSNGFGDPSVVRMCVKGSERRIRLLPANLSLPGAVIDMFCDYR